MIMATANGCLPLQGGLWHGNQAALSAGAGIVAGSDPDSEATETGGETQHDNGRTWHIRLMAPALAIKVLGSWSPRGQSDPIDQGSQ